MRADTHVHIHMYALTRVAIGSALLVPVLDASLVVTVGNVRGQAEGNTRCSNDALKLIDAGYAKSAT